MEFVKKERKVKKETIDVEQRLLNWPDCYYRERNSLVRKELLDGAEEKGLTAEDNAFRKKLFALRYPGKTGPGGEQIDNYLRAWMDIRFLAESGNGIFSKGNAKKLDRVMEEMGYNLPANQAEENLLYQEFLHLGMLYLSLCQEDKNYNAILFGFGTISEDKQARKVAAEVRKIARTAFRKFNAEEKYRLFGRAIEEAYVSMFPDYEAEMEEE